MIASVPEEEHSTTQSSYYSSQHSQQGQTGSEVGEQMYQLKTMCLAKKTVQMPTKEEHGFLLFCGLGARRWQIGMDCNSLSFKQAILNIYPRLRSVIGYNLWALTKDKKNFERIPEKVNTPRRMRSYLGSLFTGCLIIVPVSDIMLMEERREHLRIRDMKEFRDLKGPPMQNMEAENRLSRSSCLVCGKMEKTAGTGSFHKIYTETLACPEGGEVPIVRKLGDLLGFSFDVTKKRMNVSDEICRRCIKSVKELLQKEEELKAAKAELLATFFSTTSKFSRNQVATVANGATENGSGGDHENSGVEQRSGGGGNTPLSPQHLRHHLHHHHPDHGLHHHIGGGGLYGLSNDSCSQQQQLLLAAALPPSSDMTALVHKVNGFSGSSTTTAAAAAAAASLLPYYRSHLGLGDSASSCNRIIRDGYTNGESSAPASEHRRGDSSAPSVHHVNYFHHIGSGSEYTRSEVGSSSFISVSPPRQDFVPVGSYGQQTETENESRLSSSLSPRPFDTISYASSFSLKSSNSSVWPPRNSSGGTSTTGGHQRHAETVTSYKRRRSVNGVNDNEEEEGNDGDSFTLKESLRRLSTDARTGNGDIGAVKRELEDEDEEEEQQQGMREAPQPPDSPMAASPSSRGSCSSPSGGYNGDEKADMEEEEAARDRRKPWKKRRRVQESNKAAIVISGEDKRAAEGGSDGDGGCGSSRADESNESSNYEDQLDNSSSTPPQSRTPSA